MLAWIYLLIAGISEVGWAVGMKYTEGWTRLWPSIWTLIGMTISVVFLSLALKHIPLGSGYAIWTGIGAVGTAIFGVILFGEPATAIRFFFIALIVSGIVGLKIVS